MLAGVLQRLGRDLVVQVGYASRQRLVLDVVLGEGVEPGGKIEGLLEKCLLELVERLASIDLFLEIERSRKGVLLQFVEKDLDQSQIRG